MVFTGKVSWSEEAEVVIVGYGGAGAVTAITAHDAGAKVLILEKQLADTATSTNHTPSTRMSGGAFICPDDPEKALQYLCGLRRIGNEPPDSEEEGMLRVLAERMVGNAEWMQSIGGVLGGVESISRTLSIEPSKLRSVGPAVGMREVDFPQLPGAESTYIFFMKAADGYRHGASFFKTLSDAVEKRRIPVLWGASAEHLVVENGAVRGIVCRSGGKTVAIRATRGVVLACGGFEFNDWLKNNYLRPLPIHFYGNPGNEGEGVNMTLEVGAALWHMNCLSFRVTMKFPEQQVAFGTQHHSQMSIFVDKRGNRFTNERFKVHAFGYELAGYDCYAACYPRVPSYWVFDEKRRKLGAIASYHGICNPPKGVMGPIHYVWSEDNSVEIDKGWIIKASTIEELAGKIAADPDDNGLMSASNFKATVQRYNQFCKNGEDLDFHRPTSGLAPLEDPPYYAVKLWPGGPNTQGGPRRNKECQVVRPDNSPVPRLYAGGELGSHYGMLYNGGGNIAECIALGRLVGENVAAEKRWK